MRHRHPARRTRLAAIVAFAALMAPIAGVRVAAADSDGRTWQPSVALIGSNCGAYPDPNLPGVYVGPIGGGITRGVVSCPQGFRTPAMYWLSIDAAGRRIVRRLKPDGITPIAVARDGVHSTYVVDWSDFGSQAFVGVFRFDDRTGGGGSDGGYAFDDDSGTPGAAITADATGWLLVFVRHGNLFQVGTMIHTLTPVQITHDGLNSHPQLVRIGARTVLVWRHFSADHLRSTLRIATSVSLGPWQSRAFTVNGTNNDHVSLAAFNGHVYVAWERDGSIVYADNSTGAFVAHTFGARGAGPHVLAGPSPAVTWTISTPGSTRPNRVYFAERRAGAWSGGVAVNYLSVAEGITDDRGPAIVYWTPQVLKMVRLA